MNKFLIIIGVIISLFLISCGTENTDTLSEEDAIIMSALESADDPDNNAFEPPEEPTDEQPPMECGMQHARERMNNRPGNHQDDEDRGPNGEERGNRGPRGDEMGNRGPNGSEGPGNHANRLKFKKMRLKRLKWIYDADKSGDLDEAEKEELKQDLEERCLNRKAQILENFDEDGDGAISEEEREAIREFRHSKRIEHFESLLEEFDADSDGRLSREEKKAIMDAKKEKIKARREALKERFDTDESGDLDADEVAALKAFLKEFVRGEHFGEGPESEFV